MSVCKCSFRCVWPCHLSLLSCPQLHTNPLTKPPSHPIHTSNHPSFTHPPTPQTKAAADEAIAASPALLSSLDLADGPITGVCWAPSGSYVTLCTAAFEHRVRVCVAAEGGRKGGVGVLGVGLVGGVGLMGVGAGADKGEWWVNGERPNSHKTSSVAR